MGFPAWAAQIAAFGLCVVCTSASAGCMYVWGLEGGADRSEVSGMRAAPLLCMCVCPSHTPFNQRHTVLVLFVRWRVRLGGCPDVCLVAHVTPLSSSLFIFLDSQVQGLS